jgi:hypothetical protein
MPKIAMNEGRHKNTDEMVGISWNNSEPAQRKTGDPFNEFDNPEDHDKKSGDGNRIMDSIPNNLKVQRTSFTEKFQKYPEQKTGQKAQSGFRKILVQFCNIKYFP